MTSISDNTDSQEVKYLVIDFFSIFCFEKFKLSFQKSTNKVATPKIQSPTGELNPNVPEFIPPFIKLTQSLSLENDEGTDGDTEDEPEESSKIVGTGEKAVDEEDWVEVRAKIRHKSLHINLH